ncbi:MAG: OadG family protein [Lachnospiraceae bacterium]|nr:OadG family protein [Lachnospiraceae bacterium]
MKKLASILLMLTCIIGLTACGGEEKVMRHDPDVVKAQCLWMYEGMSREWTASELEMFDAYTKDEYDAYTANIYEISSIRVDGEVVVSGIHSWIDNKEEIGRVEEKVTVNDITIDAKEDELIVSVAIDGELHDAVMEMMYDKNLHIISINTNIIYSFGELMEKAGVNTLIGMGTVFAVLILISLIIGGFGFIPKIQASLSARKQVKEAVEESVDNAIAGIIEREEVSDDQELIAVIAAAIAASECASSTDGFVVRSIRKIR